MIVVMLEMLSILRNILYTRSIQKLAVICWAKSVSYLK